MGARRLTESFVLQEVDEFGAIGEGEAGILPEPHYHKLANLWKRDTFRLLSGTEENVRESNSVSCCSELGHARWGDDMKGT